jgi:hypothetical protein
MEIGHPRAATGGLPTEQATSGASRASARLRGIMVISEASGLMQRSLLRCYSALARRRTLLRLWKPGALCIPTGGSGTCCFRQRRPIALHPSPRTRSGRANHGTAHCPVSKKGRVPRVIRPNFLCFRWSHTDTALRSRLSALTERQCGDQRISATPAGRDLQWIIP